MSQHYPTSSPVSTVLFVEQVNLNHKGRIVIPKTVRKILGVEEDSQVTLAVYSNKVEISKREK